MKERYFFGSIRKTLMDLATLARIYEESNKDLTEERIEFFHSHLKILMEITEKRLGIYDRNYKIRKSE